MEFIISAIVSWITSNILDKLFRRGKNNEEIFKLRSELLKQLEEKDRQIIRLNDRQREEIKERKRIIDSITTDDRLEAICEDSKISLVLIDGGVIFEEVVPY